jgi:cysteine desulfurase
MTAREMSETYLDNNATTRPFPEVVDAVLRALRDDYGNPSSSHGAGERARKTVDQARETFAALLKARPTEIVFTSCATESINTALRGAVQAARGGKAKLVVTTVEHEATLETAQALKISAGAEIAHIPVDAEGRLDLDVARAVVTPGTALCSAMLANNETGVTSPIAELGAICRERGVPLHVDAVQGVGRFELDVEALGCDFLSLSAHKFHGPKGVGILYVRRGARHRGLLSGGPQETSRRAGTENVPGIAGAGVAARRMAEGVEERRGRLSRLSRRLEEALLAVSDTRLNGGGAERLPGVVNVSFRGIEGSSVVVTAAREGVCVSAGSACSASALAGSHVLEAMGLGYEWLHGAVRVSCSETTTPEDVDRGVDVLVRAVKALRGLTPRH